MSTQIMKSGDYSVKVGARTVIIDGVKYDKPPGTTSSISINGNKLYVNGYRFNGRGFDGFSPTTRSKPSSIRRFINWLRG